jgi:hypothetical protein
LRTFFGFFGFLVFGRKRILEKKTRENQHSSC